MAANNDLVDYYYNGTTERFVPTTALRAYDAENGSITCNVAKQGMFGEAAPQLVNALFPTLSTPSNPPTTAEVNALTLQMNNLVNGLKNLGLIAKVT